MSIINTGVYYPTSFGALSGGYIVSNIGISSAYTITAAIPLLIKPSSGKAVLLTGLSSAVTANINIEGQGETGQVVTGKDLGNTGTVGQFLISEGYSSTNPSNGQSKIQSILFAQDEDVIISITGTSSTGVTFTYNEVILV